MRRNVLASLLASIALALLPTVSWATTLPDTTMVNLSGQASTTSKLGLSMASGDFNGDGYQDLVSGAAGNSTTNNYVVVNYGSADTKTSTTLSSSNSSVLLGGTTDYFGVSVVAGNFNGDAYDDLAIGAATDSGGGGNAGKVYILYGRSANFTSESISADSAIIQITGSGGLAFGRSIAMGDVNGDGLDDLVVGGIGFGGSAGSVTIIPGSTTNYSSVGASSFSFFSGENPGDNLGTSVAVGDVTGDAYADILVGAPSNDDGGANAGAAYLIPGQASSFLPATSIASSSEFTGEAAGNAAGTTVSIASSSLTGDSNGDIVIGNNASTGLGAVYVVPGVTGGFTGTASLGAATTVEITAEATADALGSGLAIADFNQDGYVDLVIGANGYSSSTGRTYYFSGSLTGLTSVSASTAVIFSSSSAQNFGRSVGAGDLNGDGIPELLIGASTYNSNRGAIYLGYLYNDVDGDGVVGTTGLMGSSDSTITYDCSDTDATVSANQTYYADTDADTLGDPLVTTSVCASTAPTGYVTNSNDTNDTIPNNGVEISGDGLDNDGDTAIDEVNTVAENGVHPFYSLQDVTDTTTVATNITSVVGMAGGMIEVTYADDAVYDYLVYTLTATKVTNVEQYDNTGYGIVLHNKGKKVYLVNLYTGAITAKVTIKKAGFTSSAMLLKDLRSDHKSEVVVTGKTKAKVTLAIVKVSSTNGTLTKSDSEKITNKHVSVTKTKATSTKIQLRSSKSKVLETFKVTKTYTLKLV